MYAVLVQFLRIATDGFGLVISAERRLRVVDDRVFGVQRYELVSFAGVDRGIDGVTVSDP